MIVETKWTSDRIDRTALHPKILEYVEYLESLHVEPPNNGKAYTGANNNYHVGNGEKVRLGERQVNLATIMATDRSVDPLDAYVQAGYGFYSSLSSIEGVKNFRIAIDRMKGHLKGKFNRAMSPKTVTLMNFIRTDAAAQICIDAAWIMSESVSLYEQCRREGNYSNAVRLLHDLSYHVDIDSRVSNKLEITDAVDYEAILNRAAARSLPNPSIIEGEIIESDKDYSDTDKQSDE